MTWMWLLTVNTWDNFQAQTVLYTIIAEHIFEGLTGNEVIKY